MKKVYNNKDVALSCIHSSMALSEYEINTICDCVKENYCDCDMVKLKKFINFSWNEQGVVPYKVSVDRVSVWKNSRDYLG